jgi:hypothetical protein
MENIMISEEKQQRRNRSKEQPLGGFACASKLLVSKKGLI